MKSALAFQRAWRTGFRQQPIAWACLLIGACLILTMVPRQAQGLGANETQAKNMLNLDSVFIYPNGSRKFEAELWKRDNKSRFAMLFDLYHLPLSKSTPEQIYSLLGLPDDTQKDYGGGRSALSVYYDVGLKYGLQTFLSVFFRDGKLESLGIQQRSEKRFRQQNQYPAWQLQNQNWKTIAHEYNRNYFIVGMPVKLISLVAGYNPTDSSSAEDGFKKVATASSNDRVHCFGPFEFEYSLDNEKVARFRIAYGTESGKSKYTDWEDKDLRTDPRCLVRHSEYYNLKLRGEVFLGSFMPFSKTTWSGDGIRGVASINLRNAMVNDLVRSLPIIGMTRNEIQGLLGKSSTTASKEVAQRDRYAHYEMRHSIEEQKSDSLCADAEEYQLTASGCGNSGATFLEFAFRNDRVIGYRVIYVAGEGYGETDTINGAQFSYFREP